ncbi:beta-glucosidase [Truncatella angustata]|uniref:beta-glucosidase n=1 Tax=Truncatella angustata TaxID=152316 RepID=A0A9P8UI42_9PEZI|nr:beta-glucosidase [Truncatella angustata]KAH6652601.1 beta-glucosidase [Truncatella angustata]
MANLNVDEVLKKLTLSEKVDLLSGIDMWHTKAVPELGVPSVRTSDGPNGVRGTKFFNGIKAACFPCGTGLGATFNLALLKEAGKLMGDEAKAKGVHCILGPTINMQRSPLGGRGFESLGEDPFLAGLGAAALVNGIQSTGVQATIKHFVANDHEHKRNAVQVMVTERALREIYALPFQLVVKDAHPGAFMTAYNGVNGKYCSENEKLLDGLLRREWGWEGLVMSDWWGTYSTTEAALAGLDLEMPGPTRFRGDVLKFNAQTDKVREHIIDQRAKTVLEFVKKCYASGVEENAPEGTLDTPETAAVLRKIGNEGLVLLKNENDVLPFKKDKKTVVIGPNAKIATYHGGGSAALASYYAVTPFDGIKEKLEKEPDYTVGQYSHMMLPLLGFSTKSANGNQGMTMKIFNESPDVSDRKPFQELEILKTDTFLVDFHHPGLKSELFYATLEGSLTAEEDCKFELGLVVCGSGNLYVNGELVIENTTKQILGTAFFGCGTIEEKSVYKFEKGKTYDVKVEFGSTPTSKLADQAVLMRGGALRIGGCKVIDPKAEIERAAALAKDADQVIVCAGLNADWETEGADRDHMGLPPGMDDLIAAVGKANPNTAVVLQSGTPVEMPWINNVSAVVQAWYGGNETGNVIADVLFGDVNPSGKLSLSFPVRGRDNPAFLNYRTEGGRVLYGEDIYIGYRYYEFAQREVLFPFGHGLSYTTFTFSDLSVSEKDGRLTVAVSIKNTGKAKGAEVAQVYVAPKQKSKVNRPVKELKGFSKVELAPGESKTATVEIESKYAGAYWDEERDKWCVEAGEYDIIVSDSSDVKDGKAVKASFQVQKTFWWSGL